MGKFSEARWDGERPPANSRVALALRSAGVQRSSDLSRILALPRRTLDLANVEDATLAFARPGGALALRPIQSAALLEAEEAGGLVGEVGVGHGKTLIMLLLPEALRAERAVLLVPPELKRQLVERDLPFYGQSFELPLDRIAGILSYSELSVPVRVAGVPKFWQWACHLAGAIEDPLSRFSPDLIVADEAHRLRRTESARTRAFLRWFREHPETKFAALSGSLFSGSIRDGWTLARLALGKRSPLPLQFSQIASWAEALDEPRGDRPPLAPGALWLLVSPDADDGELAARGVKAGLSTEEQRSIVRDGFRRRVSETPGWVATEEASFSGSLYLRARRPKVPRAVAEALDRLRKTWEVGGEEIAEAMRLAQVARRLGCGFFYEVAWPGKPDREYVEAKRAWKREVRAFLKGRSVPGMLTEANLAAAAASGRWRAETWDAWRAVKDRWPSAGPPRRAVWVDDYLVRDALAWAEEAREGIVWASDVALAEEIAARGGFRWFGEGTDAGTTSPAADPLIVCSTWAQGEGKNLQAWSRNLVTRPSSNAKTWEQVIGRTHRPGQEADEVWFDVELPVPEAVEAVEVATRQSIAHQESRGGRLRLLLATRIGF